MVVLVSIRAGTKQEAKMKTAQYTIENIEIELLPYASRGQRFNAVGTRGGRTLINVDIKDESLTDNLTFRHSRPTKLYRQIVNQVRDGITEAHGIDLSDFVWSQRAWCSCGCSPAFLVLSSRGYRINITVSGIENKMDEKAEARAAAYGLDAKVGA